jgi:hypothetical protein
MPRLPWRKKKEEDPTTYTLVTPTTERTSDTEVLVRTFVFPHVIY